MNAMEYCQKVAGELRRCEHRVMLDMTPLQAWALMGMLQAMLRRVDLDAVSRSTADLAEQAIIDELDRQVPGLGRLARAGRDPRNDARTWRGGQIHV